MKKMGESTGAVLSGSAIGLRLYGVGCVLAGAASVAVYFGIRPGTRGVADWSLIAYTGAMLAALGIAVILLWRWAVTLFSLWSFLFGVWFLWITLLHVPFPYELWNIGLGTLALFPAFLTYRVWNELR
ncbi:MAG: hypothetical protein EOP84_29540 [Verrucomicrobiaceae bacterium]|nr:MAG: hypothetical protein EOP84_29540 [Verrucomicrobiaceae bacterium]